MATVKYRQEAVRTFAASISVAALVVALSGLAVWAGSAGLRQLAVTVAHACQRLWAALPPALQLGLILSVGVGLLAAVLWVSTLGRQWWATHAAACSLEQRAVPLPSRLRRLLEQHALNGLVTLIHDGRPIALSIGLTSPRIVLSTALLDLFEEDELEAVLLHEQSHLRHRDPASLLVTRALGTAFFFTPVVKALAGRHRAAVELAADDDAIAAQGHMLSLASAMIKLLDTNPLVAAGAFTDETDLRLSRLLDGHVALPDLPQRLKVRSGTALVLMSLP
ncbi:MAG: M56 family metallopeptidase, partial [bacterium]